MQCFKPTFSHLLIKNWYFASYGSFTYKNIISISGWWFIKFDNAFVFLDTEPTIINILYEWSRMHGHFGLSSILFLFVTSSKLIILYLNIAFRYCIQQLHTFPKFARYGYDVMLSKVCNLLSSLLFCEILSSSSVYTLWALLLNFCCDFDIISLFSKQSL